MRHRPLAGIFADFKTRSLLGGILGMLLVAGCGSGSGGPASPPAPPGLTQPSVAYVVNHNSGNISAYFLDSHSGEMADLSRSPFRSALRNPAPAVLHPIGDFLYTRDTFIGAIEVFSTNFTAGDLSPAEVTFIRDSLNWLTGMSVTPNGKYLYAAANTELDAFKILPDGSLIPLAGSPVSFAGSSLQSAVIDFSGQYLYLTDGGAIGRIFAYQINRDGSPTTVPVSPFAACRPFRPTGFR